MSRYSDLSDAVVVRRKGSRMKVFEKRGDPVAIPPKSHRSIFILLKPPTIDVLREAEMDLPSELGEYYNGITRFRGATIVRFKEHAALRYGWTGTYTISSENMMVQNAYNDNFLLLGERHDIATCLLKSVQTKYAGRVQFFFRHDCQVFHALCAGWTV